MEKGVERRGPAPVRTRFSPHPLMEKVLQVRSTWPQGLHTGVNACNCKRVQAHCCEVCGHAAYSLVDALRTVHKTIIRHGTKNALLQASRVKPENDEDVSGSDAPYIVDVFTLRARRCPRTSKEAMLAF